MLLNSRMNKAQRKNKPTVRFRWLPFLLAIALGYLSGNASAQTTAAESFTGLSSRQYHCCQIVVGNTDRPQAGSEDQIPCTCRSPYDKASIAAVSPDFLHWHPDNESSVLQQMTLPPGKQFTGSASSNFRPGSVPIYLFIARLLI